MRTPDGVRVEVVYDDDVEDAAEALIAVLLAPSATPAAAVQAAPPWQPSPQTGRCQRLERHLSELFVFVEDPAVPPTTNAAARSLRHLVVSRKISGGTRSDAGSTTKLRLASLFGTWRAQGRDPRTACRRLLANPQG